MARIKLSDKQTNGEVVTDYQAKCFQALEAAAAYSENKTDEEVCCRICLDPLTPSDQIAEPCNCKGSLRYVHISCITSWVRGTNREQCEVCNANYDCRCEYKHSKLMAIIICMSLVLYRSIHIGKAITVIIGTSSAGFILVAIKSVIGDFGSWYYHPVMHVFRCVTVGLYLSCSICVVTMKYAATVSDIWTKWRAADKIYRFKPVTLRYD